MKGKKKHQPPTPSLPLNNQKNEGKISRCTLSPPSHNEENINSSPLGPVKSNLSKLQTVKK
jgi:hypothetical protein